MTKLDKHYTDNETAKRLVNLIDQDSYDIIVEPSAGDGSICELIDQSKLIAIDISPDKDYMKKMDFFDFSLGNEKKVLTIGNPPFGYRAQKAIEFFNHAAKYSDTIAFIVPRSFRKSYIINQLNAYFHLIHDENVEVGSFVSGTSVRCCIQIWKGYANKRKKIILPKKSSDFDVIPQGKFFNVNNANYAIRRTGYSTKVGELVDAVIATPITQFIFLKIEDPLVVERIINIHKKLYKYSYESTAMSPTFTIGEFIKIYEDNKNNEI